MKMVKEKLKRIHVNRHHIAANRKSGTQDKPPFTVKTYNENYTGYELVIGGASRLVYQPARPLKCGAVAWIETHAPVFLDGERI
jgi:hypothetical protein